LLGRGFDSAVALSVVLRLAHAEPVSERIFKYGFHAVELVFRRGNEVHCNCSNPA
jgi:hypothetical protein